MARAVGLFEAEAVEAVAICFLNAFANPDHKQRAAVLVRERLPGAYLTVSADLLPSIRFYDRLSTSVLNSYVGPTLRATWSGCGRTSAKRASPACS